MLSLILGTLGMACILLAFIFDEFNAKYDQDTVFNNLLSIVGAGLLIYYALILKGWPFFVLNGVWLSVAAIKLVKIVKKKKL